MPRRFAADAVFLALPEAASAELAPTLLASGPARDRSVRRVPSARRRAAREVLSARPRRCPTGVALWADRVRARRDQVGAAAVESRAATRPRRCWALLPLQRAGLLKPGADIIIDAKSGISGAGKAATDRTHFSENHGSVAAYNLFGHRHVAGDGAGARPGR